MPYFHPDGFDAALEHYEARTDRLLFLSDYPSNYADCTLYLLGYKVTPTISGPSNRANGGRELVVATFTDGVTSATGIAKYYALVDDTDDVRIIVGKLKRETQLVAGKALELTTAIRIAIPASEDIG